MSTKNTGKTRNKQIGRDSLNLSSIDGLLNERERRSITDHAKRHRAKGAVVAFVCLLGLGVMAKNGWLPRTDPLSGKTTGWFGRVLSEHGTTASGLNPWNPFAAPPPTPVPQLSKEYIYAGSKLLAVADANADTAPPTDLAVWRPSSTEWFIFNGDSEAEPSDWWGMEGDIPVQGDYDGDGKTDFSVVRPTGLPTWWIRNSSGIGDTQEIFGNPEDIPVAADYDGDGKTDIATWRPSNQHWYIKPSTAPETMIDKYFGADGDKPVPADFDGDGKADVAVWRSTEQKFYYQNSSDGQDQPPVPMGSTGAPVCADYDGDGKADFAVRSGVNWKIKSSITGQISNTTWYKSSDIAVPNDYDGDGKVDIAVWHIASDSSNAYWCILQSSNLTPRINMFGMVGDIPVPANYRR